MSWKEENNQLTKTFEFKSFLEAMKWMQKASHEIEKLNHHPVWTNKYNKIMVCLTTHEAGSIITEKDYQLAKILDTLSTH